jgi:hypothetical protein
MIADEGVPHMMQRADGLWLCEFCRYDICKRCGRMHLEQQKPAVGLWGKEFQCTPKCRKIGKDVRQWVKEATLSRASEGGCRAHCPCREVLLHGHMLGDWHGRQRKPASTDHMLDRWPLKIFFATVFSWRPFGSGGK